MNAEQVRGCKSLGIVTQFLGHQVLGNQWDEDPGPEAGLRDGTASLNGNAALYSVRPFELQYLKDGKTVYGRKRTVGEAYLCEQPKP